MHVGERRDLEGEREQPAGHAGQCRRDDESQELVPIDVVAQRDGARLVLADGFQDLAEWRMDRPLDEQEADDEHGQHEIIHRQAVVQVDDAEQIAARHALDAVLAMGERRLQAEEIQHLRQRQRDHGEIDALAADGDAADDEPEDCAPMPRP